MFIVRPPPPPPRDLISIGAQAHVKRGAGLSGVLGTYRRIITESDSLVRQIRPGSEGMTPLTFANQDFLDYL